MNCEECKTWISSYVDQQLAAGVQSQVEEHLAGCEHCQSLVQAEIRVQNLLRESYHPEKAPFALRALIRQQLAKRSKRTPLLQLLSNRPIFTILTAVAILVVFSLAYQIYHSRHVTKQYVVSYQIKLHGTLDCIDYFLQSREPVAEDSVQLNHTLGLITDPGTIYSFVPNDISRMIQSNLEYSHQEVEVTGWIFYQANYIEIEKINLTQQTTVVSAKSENLGFADSDSIESAKGVIVCIQEELADIRHTKPVCEQVGHLYGLKTSDGTLWSFMKNPLGTRLRRDDSLRLKPVQVKGRIFHQAKTIVVTDLLVLPAESL